MTETGHTPKKAAIAAWVGSALEYYDFALYGLAAALVFPKIFFPAGNPQLATVASLATFGVAYVARPIGSFFMGYIGDKLGRKVVMIGTLLMMGLSTFLVGCLPTYSQVGMLAPILLVSLRILQGISASGEQAGANAMSFEHAPPDRRGFFTSFTLSGTQGGQVLAPAVWLGLKAILSDAAMSSWGWRIPFLLSAIVMVIGFVIRRTLEETPEFKAKVNEAHKINIKPPSPVVEVLRHDLSSVVRVFFAAFVAMINTTFAVFALAFATSPTYGINISKTVMLWLGITANLIALVTLPLWARLSDRIGRKPVFVAGLVGCAVMMPSFLWAIEHRNVALMFITGVALAGVIYSMPNSVWPATYAEYFPTRTRLSGTAIGTQFGFALAGFSPVIAATLMDGKAGNWWRIATFCVGCLVVSAIAVMSGPKDTHRTPTNELGGKRARAAKDEQHALAA